jgi:Na+-driven multidrug efflux pump
VEDLCAGLSIATIFFDQLMNLFSFQSRATEGTVSRAYSSKDTEEKNIAAPASSFYTIAIRTFKWSLFATFTLSSFQRHRPY